jgi:hypothetical protein
MSNIAHIVQDLSDILRSYYKVARKRFVDNVCMQAAGLQNRVTLRWIPAHIEVTGNEQADEVAKEGATEAKSEIYSKARGSSVRLAAAAKRAVRQRIKAQWKKEWDQNKAAQPTHRLISEPSRKVLSLWVGRSKPHAAILIQMRT